jgi:hypothetical protein
MDIKTFIEKAADLEHQRWARWQEYLHSKLQYSEFKDDGTTMACYIMDAGDFEHWRKQIDQDYYELSEAEKESDRKEVRKYFPFIKDLLIECVGEDENENILTGMNKKEIEDSLDNEIRNELRATQRNNILKMFEEK